MQFKRRRFLARLLPILIVASVPALAHRLPVAVTTVKIDGTKIEVTHRFHAHDGIRLLAEQERAGEPDLDDLSNLARIALYTERQFLIQHEDGNTDLKTLGAEREGAYVFVYQEGTLPAVTAVQLKSTVLKSLGNDWLSHVNIEQDDKIKTLIFSGKGKWQEF